MSDVLDILVRRARRNDRNAQDQLAVFLQGELQRYLRRRLRSHDRRWCESGDLIQQVLLETTRNLAQLPHGAGKEELLRRAFRTAKTRLIDLRRKHARDISPSVVSQRSQGVRERHPTDGQVTRADTERLLRRLIAALPQQYADVVRLCALEGLSYQEASERLSVSPEAIRKRYSRAHGVLRRRIQTQRSAVSGNSDTASF